jgi:hypothetical protein
MAATKKAKVMFTCEQETKEKLTKWANEEKRTVSNLVELLVTEALENKLNSEEKSA